jgi:CBS domain containing-hemolysin-like protein
VSKRDHLVHPEEFSDLEMDSPALSLLTDFRRHEPFVIDGWMSAVEAERDMRSTHTLLRLVVDRNGEFIGTITPTDLSATKLIRRVADGEDRGGIRVMDLMTRRQALQALSYSDISRARVKDVIATLRHHGEQHCLVVDSDTHCIRGLIAVADIARRLHMDIPVHREPTFAEVFAVLRRGHTRGSEPRV